MALADHVLYTNNRIVFVQINILGTGGILPIRIEAGRFHGESREERWCRICSNPGGL